VIAVSLRACLAAVLCLLASAAAPASAAVPRDWLGVMVDGPMTAPGADVGDEWSRLGDSGAGHVRAELYWPQAQPAGPDALDLTASDAVVLAAAREGLGVLPVVRGTPRWAGTGGSGDASPPRLTALAGYLKALARRYGPAGSLWTEHPEVARRPVRIWQVWNEPNLRAYWSRQPFARSYVRMLRAARAALRDVDGGARVVLAGLPNRSWTALRSVYRAGGRRAFDAVALHPYTGKPGHVVELVRLARREMARYGDRRKAVWITELSWPATEGTHHRTGFETSNAGQAKRLRRALRLLAAERLRLRIRRVYWYTWLSAEQGPSAFGWSGLRRVRDGRRVSAPALRAFVRTGRALRQG
jgi:polysaccharide biosynthesis protein PslG